MLWLAHWGCEAWGESAHFTGQKGTDEKNSSSSEKPQLPAPCPAPALCPHVPAGHSTSEAPGGQLCLCSDRAPSLLPLWPAWHRAPAADARSCCHIPSCWLQLGQRKELFLPKQAAAAGHRQQQGQLGGAAAQNLVGRDADVGQEPASRPWGSSAGMEQLYHHIHYPLCSCSSQWHTHNHSDVLFMRNKY